MFNIRSLPSFFLRASFIHKVFDITLTQTKKKRMFERNIQSSITIKNNRMQKAFYYNLDVINTIYLISISEKDVKM